MPAINPEQLTTIGLLVFVLGLLLRGDVVQGWLYKETKARLDKFEATMERTITLAERMTDIVEEFGIRRPQ